MTKNNPTIFIIDDEVNVCHALSWLFKSVQFNVETYENAQLFLEKYNPEKHGCIIMDVRLPGMSGLELLEQLKTQRSNIPVIIITGYGDIQMAVRAMKAGAVDFILKPFNDQCLLETVQKCISKIANTNSIDLIQERINNLSERERQIINLILDGKLNKQIAYELSISISTVEAHRANIMHKMQAKNVAQLIKMYLQVQFNNEYSNIQN
ncbi:response regulator transcription factor [Legionella sp. km772]|uniref:response regulator transcription factor n=1 Tax=Legionella sp. km772 TaxID=2498111 RepID=UPI000F8C99EB|nr:response regulator transcription factor [Legionella sp. km772]RUR09435.1 response regulator transcription factor [Legionella sp. km772]